MKKRAYIALGSNLNNPTWQVSHALSYLSNLSQSYLITHSSLYRTKPLGQKIQPDYINAVAAIDTTLSPCSLLKETQQIEQMFGRKYNKEHHGSRILDLDILLYASEIIYTKNLIIPHYDIKNRNFVLYPLAEISPQLILPDGSKIKELLRFLEPLQPI